MFVSPRETVSLQPGSTVCTPCASLSTLSSRPSGDAHEVSEFKESQRNREHRQVVGEICQRKRPLFPKWVSPQNPEVTH